VSDSHQSPPERPSGEPPKPRKRRRPITRALRATILSIVLLIVAGAAAAVIGYVLTPIPDPNQLVTANATIVYYADGTTQLGRFAARNRISVPLTKISPDMQEAVIAAENRSFWTDNGISPKGMVRALWADVRGQPTQGASTITQQYVKNYYLNDDQTLSRKVRELFITLKVQRKLGKRDILDAYLNTVYFGRGAYGVQTAAHTYFGVPASKLTAEQSAVLASVLKAPAYYDPAEGSGNVSHLRNRYHYVLEGMAAAGHYPKHKAATVKLPAIKKVNRDEQFKGPRGYLLAAAKQELLRRGISEQEINGGGLRVITTFEPKAQKAAEQAVKQYTPKQDAKGLHVGLAAVQPGTGDVVALYGGADYLKHPYSDATQATFQPGSTFKAFTLAAMLNEGISLKDHFSGNTLYFGDGGMVRNEFGKQYGPSVSMLYATEESINTAFVDVTRKIGPQKVVDAAIAAGVPKNPKDLQAVPVVTLGVASETPLTMANAYATFADQGKRAQPHTIKSVSLRSGRSRLVVDPKPKQTIDADVSRDVTYALQQVVKHGTGTAAQALGRPAAGKTGTHEDTTAWFVGYTPQLSAAVGFYKVNGKGQRQSLDGVGGLSTFFGAKFPAELWTAFMKGALAGQPVKQFPPPAWVGVSDHVVTSTPTPSRTAPASTSPKPAPTPTRPSSPSPAPSKTATPNPPPSSPSPKPTPTQTPPPTSTPVPSHSPPPSPRPSAPPPSPAPSHSPKPPAGLAGAVGAGAGARLAP
jgi:membrane peptidoglycan carboxypeptidase